MSVHPANLMYRMIANDDVFYLGCGAIKARTKSIEVVMERYLPLIHVPLIERYTKRTMSSVYYTRRHVLFWGIGNSFRSGKVDQKGPCAFLLLIGVMTKIYLTLYQMLFVASSIACTASRMYQWCVSEWALNALYVIASRSDVWRCCSSRE